jgi:hypothetical protein
MGDEHDEHGHDPYEPPERDAPRQALEGEIVVYRPYPGSGYSTSDGRRGPRTEGPDIGYGHKTGGAGFGPGEKFGPRSYDQGLVREVIAYTVAHPHEGIRKIAARFGVSQETVRRWTRADLDKRSSAVDTPQLRAEAAIHLEGVRAEAWAIYQALKDAMHVGEEGHGLPHPAYLKALQDTLTRVESVTGTHAKLMGLNMPVKVDVQLTELTEAERELQEMVREAQARAAAAEAAVIAEASEDPEL